MKTRIVFVSLTWLGAFVVVMAVYLLFGSFLGKLALPARALIVSGILAVTMTQVVVPLIGRVFKIGPGPRE
ncbi:MAG: hypothetical protein ACRDIU_00435 [Actinomycetota bacterium]